jgi:hypothetical protein
MEALMLYLPIATFFRVKLPRLSVAVPWLVFTSEILTYGMGRLVAMSVTLPLMVCVNFCEYDLAETQENIRINEIIRIICLFFVSSENTKISYCEVLVNTDLSVSMRYSNPNLEA